MFATILDRYPGAEPNPRVNLDPGAEPGFGAPEHGQARLERVLRAQFDAGMGMLGDGVVWDVSSSSAAIDAAVEAWNEANDLVRILAAAETPTVDPPLVKACLLGPWTAAISVGDESRTHGAVAAHFHDTIELLFEAGAPVVQLVEDGLAGLDPRDANAVTDARSALEVATREVNGHVSLSVGGGNVDRLGHAFFFDLPVASYAFDLINGPDNWRLIARAPADRGIVCGVADCRTAADDEEAVMIWAARYAASTNDRGLERVGLCPSSGLGVLSSVAAARKLATLASAARKAGLPPDELATAVDPRAVDARSGALGRYDRPKPRPR